MIGKLRLRVVNREGRSVLAESSSAYPLQALRPQVSDDGAGLELVILTPCGGLLNHDELHAEIEVEEGASLLLRTQAATQVHNGQSAQEWRIVVGANAQFSFMPRALVPHAEAVHHVATTVSAASSASVLLSEVISPGREHRGERFAYQELRSDLDIWCEGLLVARERQLVRPLEGLLPMQLGRHSHFGSAYLFRDIAQALDVEQFESTRDVLIGVSELASDGRCIRALGHRAFDLEALFEALAASQRQPRSEATLAGLPSSKRTGRRGFGQPSAARAVPRSPLEYGPML